MKAQTILDVMRSQMEQGIYDELWSKFLEEQQEQVKRIDKLVQKSAERQAKILAKKVEKELEKLRKK